MSTPHPHTAAPQNVSSSKKQNYPVWDSGGQGRREFLSMASLENFSL